jgi:hypothetical protein
MQHHEVIDEWFLKVSMEEVEVALSAVSPQTRRRHLVLLDEVCDSVSLLEAVVAR